MQAIGYGLRLTLMDLHELLAGQQSNRIRADGFVSPKKEQLVSMNG